jgi:hypothetical protein
MPRIKVLIASYGNGATETFQRGPDEWVSVSDCRENSFDAIAADQSPALSNFNI